MDRAEYWPALIVEVEASPGSGVFCADVRLRADEIMLSGDDHLSTARVAARLDHDFDARAARDRYLPDLRLLIRTGEPEPLDRAMLFEGYPLEIFAEQDGRPGRPKDELVLDLEHVYGRLSRDPRAWIYGRRMRNAAILDGLAADPPKWQAASTLVTALPCIFNLDGLPNRAATPLAVTAPDGSPRSIPVFTFEGDPAAKRWTYLQALRYLFWFYRLPEGPVGEGNLFTATDACAAFDPDAPGPLPHGELLNRLIVAPESLTCEATSLVEALALLCEECGVHIHCETVNAAGTAQSRMRVWSPGDGEAKTLGLAWGGRYADGAARFDTAAMSAAEVFAANQVVRAVIAWDARRIVNAPIVIGGVRHHEMTLPLVPGWLPEDDLDNVAVGDRPDAQELALTPDQIEVYPDDVTLNTWYRRYHKNGAEFNDHRDVARLWVLNEDGRFAAAYNRNAPFNAYGPFDFSTVADDSVATQGAWTRRVRKLMAAITVTEDGEPFGVFAEVSFDGGVTWHVPPGPVRVRFDPTGVYFDAVNPTSITPPGALPEEQNLWYAIIDQTFRVRVTALVESDDRLLGRYGPDDRLMPALRTTSRVVYRPTRFRFESRAGTTNVLAGVNPTATNIGVDDSAGAGALADRIARQEQADRVLVTPTIPWLETAIAIGDRITGIRGREMSLAGRAGREAPAPCVLSKRYRLSGGRLETELGLGVTELPT